jgi:outer membrane protein assembly factor BamB
MAAAMALPSMMRLIRGSPAEQVSDFLCVRYASGLPSGVASSMGLPIAFRALPGEAALRTRMITARYRSAMTGWPCSSPRVTGLLALASAPVISVISVFGAGHAAAAPLASQPSDASSWTVYHHDLAGTGVAEPVTAVDTSTRAWTSPAVDGEIYGEPLVSSGRVYVATENATVYALSSATGRVVWATHVGTPVPAQSLPCGDIGPTVGITGTPVIDQSRGEIFAVADELVRGKPAHMLVGLAMAAGRIEMTQDVDPAGADTAALLQRTGLTLDAGQVVFGFGGNDGDCASYRGRLEAVPETGGRPVVFTVDAAAGQSQGAIWMGGAAPAVDSSGHLLVSVGNGSVRSDARAYDDSDSVLDLSPGLRLLQFFAPSTWASDNSQDLDMSTEPVPLSDGQVMLAGKSGIVYLLDSAHLGGIGGQLATLRSACSDNIDGGSAVAGTTVYLPCLSGIIAVRAVKAPAALHLLWSSGTGGGPPIMAAGLVWTIARDTLYGLSPATGRVRQQASIGGLANHFPTPSVGDGLLLVPTADQVVAFTATARGSATTGPAASPGAAAATHPANRPKAADGAATSPGAIAGIVVGAIVVLAGTGWFLWRRRVRGTS